MIIEGLSARNICEFFNFSYGTGVKVSFDVNDRDKLKADDPSYSILSISGKKSPLGIERIDVVSYFGGRTELLIHWANFSRKFTMQPDSMKVRTYNRLKTGGLSPRKNPVTHTIDNPRGKKVLDAWHSITSRAVQEAINYGERHKQAGKIEAMFGGLLKLKQ